MAGGGNIEKRGGNSYRLEYAAGFDTNGERIRYRKTISAKSMTEAKNQLALFIAECERGEYCNMTNMTLKDFSDKWLKEYVQIQLAPATQLDYEKELKNWILPALGHIKLKNLKPLHIVQFYNSLETASRLDGKEGTISGKSKLNLHRILSSMLNDAVQWQIMASNPTTKVAPPKTNKTVAESYDEEWTAKLLECLAQEEFKWQVITCIAIYTGMRRGEIMGLEWKDIDFNNSFITIVRSSQYIPGVGLITKEPKTESSKRRLTVSDFLIDTLKKYKEYQSEEKEKCGDKWIENDRLFTAWNGEPMHPDSVCNWFTKFIKKYLLPKISFKSLRHTNATILINKGINIRAVSARLGHANTSTTLNIYTHALQSVDRAAANVLEETLTNNEKIS